MPITYHDIEDKVIEACYDLAEQEIPNVRATARKYEVPRGRLQRRWTRQSNSYIESGGANKALDDEAEQALCAYIDFAEDLGMPIREKSLSKTANSILRARQNREGPPRTVSKMWASRWLQWHPE
jgi:Tc5 transposase DNA-binding domain